MKQQKMDPHEMIALLEKSATLGGDNIKAAEVFDIIKKTSYNRPLDDSDHIVAQSKAA